MKTQIFKDYSEFLNREDKNLNGVTQQFADQNPNWAEERNNEGCWNCSAIAAIAAIAAKKTPKEINPKYSPKRQFLS